MRLSYRTRGSDAAWRAGRSRTGSETVALAFGGNNYRLLTIVSYQRREIVIHELITHAQYSRKYGRRP
jgi:mRNA-degrading endonuclease HigB of HigAB toxin-antitoxin module